MQHVHAGTHCEYSLWDYGATCIAEEVTAEVGLGDDPLCSDAEAVNLTLA